MNEDLEVKNDVAEIKVDVKALAKSMSELQVLVAGNYVTKEEFVDSAKENRTDHNKIWGALIAFCIVIVGWIFNK